MLSGIFVPVISQRLKYMHMNIYNNTWNISLIGLDINLIICVLMRLSFPEKEYYTISIYIKCLYIYYIDIYKTILILYTLINWEVSNMITVIFKFWVKHFISPSIITFWCKILKFPEKKLGQFFPWLFQAYNICMII